MIPIPTQTNAEGRTREKFGLSARQVLPQLDAYHAGRQLQHLQLWISVVLAQRQERVNREWSWYSDMDMRPLRDFMSCSCSLSAFLSCSASFSVVMEEMAFLGDTRSRFELLVFAQANPARLPLTRVFFSPISQCEE